MSATETVRQIIADEGGSDLAESLLSAVRAEVLREAADDLDAVAAGLRLYETREASKAAALRLRRMAEGRES